MVTNLVVFHFLIEENFEREVVIVLLLLRLMNPYIVTVNHSEQSLEFLGYELSKMDVSDSGTAKGVELIDKFGELSVQFNGRYRRKSSS